MEAYIHVIWLPEAEKERGRGEREALKIATDLMEARVHYCTHRHERRQV